MPEVHPTACVEDGAILAPDVSVGPFSFIGREVELGPHVQVAAHVTLLGRTRIAADCRIFPHACLGGEPQVRGFKGGSTKLEIGLRTEIRENVTIHLGTAEGGGYTRIGDDNYIMNGAHIGHDCQIGNETVIASFCGLGGHARVDDYAVLGAYTGLHQFTRVGESVMVAGGSKISLDAPPFAMVAGDRARLVGLNSVGLRRRGFSAETCRQIKHAFHLIFRSKLRLEAALAKVAEEMGGVPEVERLVSFLQKSERGFCR